MGLLITTSSRANDFADIIDVAEALEGVIQASDPDKRAALAKTIDLYAESLPDFHWGISGQAPYMLCQLLMCIDTACRPESASKPRPVLRMVPRKH